MSETYPRSHAKVAIFICLCAASVLLFLSLPAISGASLTTRSCGQTSPPGLPVAVRATRNVTCAQARRIMKNVDGETNSHQCYSGPGQFHPCRVEGFYCTMRSTPGTDISSTTCTKRRNKLVRGYT